MHIIILSLLHCTGVHTFISSQSAWSEGWQPPGADLHSADELRELLAMTCDHKHDYYYYFIIIFIIIIIIIIYK